MNLKYSIICLVILSLCALSQLQVITQQESLYAHEFEELLEEVGSNSSEILSLNELKLILNRLNETCLTAEHVFDALDTSVNDGLNSDEFAQASVIIMYYYQQTQCNITITDNIVTEAKQGLLGGDVLCKDRVQIILNGIQDGGKYSPNVVEGNEQVPSCFGAGSLIERACLTEDESIYLVTVQIVRRLNRGDCFLPKQIDFVNSLFEFYNSVDQISDEVFSDILAVFNIGGVTEDDHDDHDHDDDHDDHDAHDAHDDHDAHDAHDDHDDHGEEGKRRKKRNVEPHLVKCYSSTELLDIFAEAAAIGDEKFLTAEQFTQSCPAILQQHLTGACATTENTSQTSTVSYTTAQKYGYGTAAVLIISLLAFGGLLFFPAIGTDAYKLTMQFFIALGVGTLSGDALLHLLPEVVGLHGHDEGGAHDEHDHEEEDQSYIWKILVVIGGIYFFYLFENGLRLWNRIRGTNINFHSHSEDDHHHHIEDGNDGSGHHTVTNTVMQTGGLPHSESVHNYNKSNSKIAFEDVDENGIIKTKMNSSTSKLTDENGYKKPNVFCGFSTIAIMVFIGDLLHNFGDGLALGVAFSSSWVSGVGASIAIFCHELPHEFGDFAIYMRNGMSKWRALLMNFVAACFAFIGLYIGLSIAENAEAREWMLAIIAGMFLYIALVDVMHEMIEERSDHPILQFCLQNLGLLLGWAILLLLALYEDAIRMVLT